MTKCKAAKSHQRSEIEFASDAYLPVYVNLREIEERVADIRAAEGSEFLFELLRAYGIPKASITRLRSGSYNRSEQEGEYLWRGKVYYRSFDCPDEELYAAVDAAKAEERSKVAAGEADPHRSDRRPRVFLECHRTNRW